MVEIFDVHRLYHISICDPKVRYQTVKISEHFAVLFHQCRIVLGKVLNIDHVNECCSEYCLVKTFIAHRLPDAPQVSEDGHWFWTRNSLIGKVIKC